MMRLPNFLHKYGVILLCLCIVGCQSDEYMPHEAFEKIIVRERAERKPETHYSIDDMPMDNDMDYYLRPVTDYNNSVTYDTDTMEVHENSYPQDNDAYYSMPDHMSDPYHDNDMKMYHDYHNPYYMEDGKNNMYHDKHYPKDNDQDFMPPMEGNNLGDHGADNYPLYFD